MAESLMFKRIEITPKKLGGKPVIKGTKIPVHLILEMLAEGMSAEEILKEHPELEKEDIRAAIGYASRILSKEVLYEVPAR
ncbi:MAG: DUF433 domain-containing protein [Methanophagales archaeon]|nr:DUF433 domain-containing protein [Methanophagales archaeon]